MKFVVSMLLVLAMASVLADQSASPSEEKLEALFNCPESVGEGLSLSLANVNFEKMESELHQNWPLSRRVQYRVHLFDSHHCARITSLGRYKVARIATLCTGRETPIFSCGIGEKTVSLCESDRLSNGELALHYRYGMSGKPPELEYPKGERPASTVFSFATGSGPTLVISIENKAATYDLMSGLEESSIRQLDFIGLIVTIGQTQGSMRACNQNNVWMNLQPLEFAGYFPEKAMPAKVHPSRFKIVHKEISHGPKWTGTLEYPIVGDEAVDSEIKAYIPEDCYSEAYSSMDGSCSQTVKADVVHDRYLTLTFDSYAYETGAAHGNEEISRHSYMKAHNRWVHIADDAPLAVTDNCQQLVSNILFRKVAPQLIMQATAQPGYENRMDILKAATQVITDEGIRFEFQMYTFGSRIPPSAVVVPYKTLGACFAPKPEEPRDMESSRNLNTEKSQ